MPKPEMYDSYFTGCTVKLSQKYFSMLCYHPFKKTPSVAVLSCNNFSYDPVMVMKDFKTTVIKNYYEHHSTNPFNINI